MATNRDFNDTHFTEELIKLGITLSRESVRVIRRESGIAQSGNASSENITDAGLERHLKN